MQRQNLGTNTEEVFVMMHTKLMFRRCFVWFSGRIMTALTATFYSFLQSSCSSPRIVLQLGSITSFHILFSSSFISHSTMQWNYKYFSWGTDILPNARECNWATLFLEEINAGTWPSRLGSLKNRDNKMRSLSPVGLRSKKSALAISSKNCKLQNQPLDREGASQKRDSNLQKSTFGKEAISGHKYQSGFETTIYRLIFSRNVTLILTLTLTLTLTSPMGLRSESGFAGDVQQKRKTTNPASRQRGHPKSLNP
jgi:hypothetical protein